MWRGAAVKATTSLARATTTSSRATVPRVKPPAFLIHSSAFSVASSPTRRQKSNDDAGDEADLDLQVEFEEEGGEEGEEGEEGGEEQEVMEDDGRLVADLVDDDMPARMREALELKQALELSAAAAAPPPPAAAAVEDDEDDDEEELAAAIALSLQAPPAKRSRTADENSPPEPSAGESS